MSQSLLPTMTFSQNAFLQAGLHCSESQRQSIGKKHFFNLLDMPSVIGHYLEFLSPIQHCA